MNDESKGMIKLCGLWKNQTKDSKVYYSGGLSYSTNLLLFPNAYKESSDDKKPDLILYIARKEKKEGPEKTETGDEVPF